MVISMTSPLLEHGQEVGLGEAHLLRELKLGLGRELDEGGDVFMHSIDGRVVHFRLQL